jgi:hypothetical protein
MFILGNTSTEQLADPGRDRAPHWYTFTWPVGDDPLQRPRGGTTVGPPVTPAREPTAQWSALWNDALTPLERDRRAILALAGEYRTTFDFLETATYVPGLERDQPYQSWATEFIFVVDERDDFISLQHILVMHVVDRGDDGERLVGPMVQKHWRQDWRYQADRSVSFQGGQLWEVAAIEPRAGSWTQTVHEVDETPRYAATGAWVHDGNLFYWESERRWRPLPRREHTVREDYGALATVHRISLTPGGWAHEQDNLKVAVAEPGHADPRMPYLAREQGFARYTRIADYDFEAGRRYWSLTADYWRQVRLWWQKTLAREGGFRLHAEIDGVPLFVPLFEGAARVAEDPEFGDAAQADYLHQTLSRYVDAP